MNRFLTWFAGLSRMGRYFVVAVLIHLALVTAIGTVKIAPDFKEAFKKVVTTIITDPPGTKPVPIDEPGTPEGIMAVLDGLRPSAKAVADRPSPNPALGSPLGQDGPTAGPRPGAAGSSGVIGPEATGPIDVIREYVRADVEGDGALPLPTPGGQLAGDPTVNWQKRGTPYGSRFDVGHRLEAIKIHVSDLAQASKLEQRVVAALRWLKNNQKADGSWQLGAGGPAGTTLATLTFLGHGDGPDSKEFGPTVSRALRYLVGEVKADGTVPGNMYVQALVGLALSEALTITRSPSLREPLERVTKVITAAQQVHKENPLHAGGWRYSPQSTDADLSVAGWQILALKSARTAGLELPVGTFDKATEYVWNMYGAPGFGYSGPGATPNMTAVGVLCQQFLGNYEDRRLKPALEFLAKQKMDWDNAKGVFILYGWYYTTQALFQEDKSGWRSWNAQMQHALLGAQKEDGHWDAPDGSNEKTYGPVYSTTLCALMLEVYYRHLPMYKIAESEKPAPLHPAAPALRAKL